MARNTVNKEIIKGRNMMLFKPNGESYAYCVSNRLVISTTTSNISTKDHGQWNALSADKYNWTVSSEYLTTDEFGTLFNAMITNELVLVKFGEKIEDDPDKTVADGDYEAWHLNGQKTYYQGYAVITNIEQTAVNSEIAQFTIEMQGIGKLIAKDDLAVMSTKEDSTSMLFSQDFSSVNFGMTYPLENVNVASSDMSELNTSVNLINKTITMAFGDVPSSTFSIIYTPSTAEVKYIIVDYSVENNSVVTNYTVKLTEGHSTFSVLSPSDTASVTINDVQLHYVDNSTEEWRECDILNPITENYSFLRQVEVPVLDENASTLDKTLNITRTWNSSAWTFTEFDPEEPTGKGKILVAIPNYNVSFGIQAASGDYNAKTFKFSVYATGSNIYCTIGGESVTLQPLIPQEFTLTIPDNNATLENNFNFIVNARGSGVIHIFYPRFSELVTHS